MFHTTCVCKQLLASAKGTTLQQINTGRHTVINGKTEEEKIVKRVKEDKSSRMNSNIQAFQWILLATISIHIKRLATQSPVQESQNSRRTQTSTKTE
jgi:hypothetical protein